MKEEILGKNVKVKIDRKLGTVHPTYHNIIYEVNYGFIEGIVAGDGEEQDAYVIGVDKPIDIFYGKVVAIVQRNDDIEDKWVVTDENRCYSKEEIEKIVHFQEKYFDINILM